MSKLLCASSLPSLACCVAQGTQLYEFRPVLNIFAELSMTNNLQLWLLLNSLIHLAEGIAYRIEKCHPPHNRINPAMNAFFFYLNSAKNLIINHTNKWNIFHQFVCDERNGVCDIWQKWKWAVALHHNKIQRVAIRRIYHVASFFAWSRHNESYPSKLWQLI